MTIAVLNAFIRPLLEGKLPEWLEPRYFASTDELYALAPQAGIGWFDSYDDGASYKAAALATKMGWLNSLGAGIEGFPLDLLRQRGVTFTNGAGLNAIPIAEYVVMAMLTIAKGWREVVRSAERHEWLTDAPGKQELYGSSALIIGAGGIGGMVYKLLVPFGVACSVVRRTPGGGVLGPDDWRASLPSFDWVIVAVPSTADTEHMIGAAELALMKSSAVLINVARGEVIDQPALVEALKAKRIHAAFLDVTTPEPLPAGHALWSLDNCHISMHLSGRSQSKLFLRAAERFLANLARFERGEALESTVDLTLGY
jgi:phosphoglycerate dehydrogenase-like enzyme